MAIFQMNIRFHHLSSMQSAYFHCIHATTILFVSVVVVFIRIVAKKTLEFLVCFSPHVLFLEETKMYNAWDIVQKKSIVACSCSWLLWVEVKCRHECSTQRTDKTTKAQIFQCSNSILYIFVFFLLEIIKGKIHFFFEWYMIFV